MEAAGLRTTEHLREYRAEIGKDLYLDDVVQRINQACVLRLLLVYLLEASRLFKMVELEFLLPAAEPSHLMHLLCICH
jgi:hypothetical protein